MVRSSELAMSNRDSEYRRSNSQSKSQECRINFLTTRDQSQEELSGEAIDKRSRALGQAVARYWSSLPQEIQHNLFESAVTSEGETMRQQLAVHLYGKHERTVDAVQARAMPEPDSLGG